jgi:adenine specific DNA methylase Mod
MKTSNLTGIALNWAVEKAKGTFWSNGYFHYPKNHPIFTYPYTKETVSYDTESP